MQDQKAPDYPYDYRAVIFSPNDHCIFKKCSPDNMKVHVHWDIENVFPSITIAGGEFGEISYYTPFSKECPKCKFLATN